MYLLQPLSHSVPETTKSRCPSTKLRKLRTQKSFEKKLARAPHGVRSSADSSETRTSRRVGERPPKPPRGLARASGADQAGRPSGPLAPQPPDPRPLGFDPRDGTWRHRVGRISRADPREPNVARGGSPLPPSPRPAPRPDANQGQTAAGSANNRTPGAGVRRQVRPGSPQRRPVQPPLPLAVEGGRRPGRGAGWLTLGPSSGTRGSFHVVVRLLWSTKKGQPVCGSILISQPGGRGSPAPLPDAICTMGEWVAALMLGRGLPGGAAAGVPGRGELSRGVPGLQAPSRSLAAAGSRAVRAADVSGKPAPGTLMN